MRFPQSILISCEIPWDEREKFVEPIFRQEVQHLLKLGFLQLYIFGTAGEGYAVDTARFTQIAKVFFEETRGECPFPQVGLIGLSTANVCERLEIAMAIGFRDFQLALPSWGALSDSEVLRFFRDVCLTHPESRFLHYNLMRSKRLLTGADYRRIADEVPNLVATKNTSPDLSHAMDLLRLAPEMQHFLSEVTFPVCCAYGECSLLSSFAGMFPAATKKLFSYGRERSYERLFQFQKEYLAAVDDVIGPMIQHSRIDGAYDKTIVRLGGLPMPSRLLSPYEGIPEEVYQESKRILDTQHFEWLA
jgi:dihydrodipicolinate synthase/N-acetylneuraminate lyase